MKSADLKLILLELINETLFGQKLKVQIEGNLYPALISKNTRTAVGEDQYRLSWFNSKDMSPRGHMDFNENYKNYILKNKHLPMGLKIKFFKNGVSIPQLIFEVKQGPRHNTGADILVGTIDPNDGYIESKWGGSHSSLQTRNNKRGDWRFNDESRNVYWHDAHPRIYESYVDAHIEGLYGFKANKHITLDNFRSNPIAYEWFWNDSHGLTQKDDKV